MSGVGGRAGGREEGLMDSSSIDTSMLIRK